jgi:nucleoside-diphosphate-sugar epimerase
LRDTESAIDFIHVRDVAKGLVALALVPGPSGSFNLGSGAATRVSDIVSFIQDCILGNIKSHDFQKVVSDNATWAVINSMHQHFGWKPEISLADGIRELI